jgi:hypothetical protein
MSEQSLQAGERRQTETGDILALSPLPVETGAEASDPVQWIRQKNNEWMDLQGGNLVFAAEFALMFLSLAFLTTILVGILPSLIKWSDWGYFSWGPPLFVLVLHVFLTLPWGLVIHFRTNKELKESPLVRLNRVKRQIAIPRWGGGQDVKVPFWGEGAWIGIYVIYMFTIFALLVPLTEDKPFDDYQQAYIFWSWVVFGIENLIFIPYIATAIYFKKKHAPRLEYVYYPWEKLVAYIEKRDAVGPALFTEQVMLTLAVPDPDDPETALAATSISVGHETAGIAQWESLRRFMEDGPEACPDPQNNDTLAHYKESCRKARQEKSTGAWLWKKVGDWFFQRYLAYKITEWRTNKLMPRSLPQELHDWSEPVPGEEQAKPSEELQKANRQIRAMRRKKPRLTPRQLLEAFYRSSTEHEKLLA